MEKERIKFPIKSIIVNPKSDNTMYLIISTTSGIRLNKESVGEIYSAPATIRGWNKDAYVLCTIPDIEKIVRRFDESRD